MANGYICDRCGYIYMMSETEYGSGTMGAWLLSETMEGGRKHVDGKFDLCKECYEELNNWLTDRHYEIKHFPPLMEVE